MSFKVNGKRYDWGDVELHIPGLSLDIDEISYGDKVSRELVYGLGRKPKGHSVGNYEPNCKMQISREDYGNLLEYCDKKGIKLYELHFEKIAVSYANDNNPMMVDIIPDVYISQVDSKAAQDDKGLKIPLELFVAGVIKWNGVDAI